VFTSCLKKQDAIKALFAECPDTDSRYFRLIELGRELPPFPEEGKGPDNLVKGCQSTTYLHCVMQEEAVMVEAASDALISAGLAALLIHVYSGERPEVFLQCAPTYLEEIGIYTSLTPNRANGLASMHLHMKQQALKLLVSKG